MPVQWLYLTWGAAILALCLIPAARRTPKAAAGCSTAPA